jgi:hypothetical protein
LGDGDNTDGIASQEYAEVYHGRSYPEARVKRLQQFLKIRRETNF